MIATYIIIIIIGLVNLLFFIINNDNNILGISLNNADIYTIIITFTINTLIFYYYAIIDYIVYVANQKDKFFTQYSLLNRLKIATIQMLCKNKYAYISAILPQYNDNSNIIKCNMIAGDIIYCENNKIIKKNIINDTIPNDIIEIYISGNISVNDFSFPCFYGTISDNNNDYNMATYELRLFNKYNVNNYLKKHISDMYEYTTYADEIKQKINNLTSYYISGIFGPSAHDNLCNSFTSYSILYIFFLMMIISVMICILFIYVYPKCSNPIIEYKLYLDTLILLCEIFHISNKCS